MPRRAGDVAAYDTAALPNRGNASASGPQPSVSKPSRSLAALTADDASVERFPDGAMSKGRCSNNVAQTGRATLTQSRLLKFRGGSGRRRAAAAGAQGVNGRHGRDDRTDTETRANRPA